MRDAARAAKRWVDLEALIWAAALAAVAIGDPNSDTHFTLFWPQWVFGVQSPGHGLGHSIGHLFRGDLQASLASHWLGAPAAAAIAWRAASLQARRMRGANRREQAAAKKRGRR